MTPNHTGWPYDADELLVAVYADGSVSTPENLPFMRLTPTGFHPYRLTAYGEERVTQPYRLCMVKDVEKVKVELRDDR